MSENNSIARPAQSKPAKPYPDFPLTAHPALVFMIKYGKPWLKNTSLAKPDPENAGAVRLAADNPISKETGKMLKELNIARPGLNFYAQRHTTETIGGRPQTRRLRSHHGPFPQ